MKVKLFLTFWFACLLVSCSSDNSDFYVTSVMNSQPRILLSSAAAGNFGVVMYNIDGTFMEIVRDYMPFSVVPRGLVALDAYRFRVATDGSVNDVIQDYDLLSGIFTPFTTTNDLSGNVFHMRRHETLGTVVIESNVIESFAEDGQRIGVPRVPAVVGACTLNIPRGLAFTANDLLVVVNTGNDDLNVYDISNPLVPVCMTANTSFGNTDPVAVLAHSDGFLYVATQGDDRIYRFNGDGTGVPTVVLTTSA